MREPNGEGNRPSENRSAVHRVIRLLIALYSASVIFSLIAFLKEERIVNRVFLLVAAGALFLFASFLLWAVLTRNRRVEKPKGNFFLYDPAIKGNRPVEELTFETVRDRLAQFMYFFRKGNHVYLSSFFDEESGVPEAFRPLLCYQILGIMSAGTRPEQWRAFLDGGKEFADVLSTYLGVAGDGEIGARLQVLFAGYDGKDVEPIRQYVTSKSEYLSQRLLAYAKEHIREFDP